MKCPTEVHLLQQQVTFRAREVVATILGNRYWDMILMCRGVRRLCVDELIKLLDTGGSTGRMAIYARISVEEAVGATPFGTCGMPSGQCVSRFHAANMVDWVGSMAKISGRVRAVVGTCYGTNVMYGKQERDV